MNNHVHSKTNFWKVQNLYKTLAGDKLVKCDALAETLVLQGFKQERAWAEALDVFKCVKNESVED